MSPMQDVLAAVEREEHEREAELRRIWTEARLGQPPTQEEVTRIGLLMAETRALRAAAKALEPYRKG